MRKDYEEMKKIAQTDPDVLGAMRAIGIELKLVSSRGGKERYQTTTTAHRAGDLSSVVVLYEDGKWTVIDNKRRYGRLAMDAIQAIRDFGNMGFMDAVKLLAGNRVSAVGAEYAPHRPTRPVGGASEEESPEPEEFQPPTPRDDLLPRAAAYLTKTRKIPTALVSALISRKLIYAALLEPKKGDAENSQDNKKKPLSLCAFRITDEEGKVVGVDTCSTLSYVKFKHIATGSNPEYAWCFPLDVDTVTPDTPLFFCESPIDAMSLCALSGRPGIYISMAGLKDRTLTSMAQRLGGKPVICVDSDDGGDRFAARFPQYERWTVPHGKDWNDCLKHYVEAGMNFAMQRESRRVAVGDVQVPESDAGVPAESVPSDKIETASAPSEEGVPRENEDPTIESIRQIGRKSVNRFSESDFQVTAPWEARYRAELGVKSPFFRARFGDWREYDQTLLTFQEVNSDFVAITDIPKGEYLNSDTGWNIRLTRDGIDETAHKTMIGSPSYRALQDAEKLIGNAVLLDTVVVTDPSKQMGRSAVLVHHLYTPIITAEQHAIAKLYVTENMVGDRRFYLNKVELLNQEEASRAMVSNPANGKIDHRAIRTAGNASVISIAQLFAFVKTYDTKFERDSKNPVYFEPHPADPSKLNKDGTPAVSYEEGMAFSMGRLSSPKDDDLLHDEAPLDVPLPSTAQVSPTEQATTPAPSTPESSEDPKKQIEQELRSRVTSAVAWYRSDPKVLADLLAFSARFRGRYSFANQRLIWCQNPDARYVASAGYFKAGMPDGMGKPATDTPIYIRKGEKALRIWKPYEQTLVYVPDETGKEHRVPLRYLDRETRARFEAEGWRTETGISYTLVPVFDIAQTTAPPEVYPTAFGFGGTENRNAEEMCRAVIAYAENELHCPVTTKDLQTQRATVRGYFDSAENSITLSDMLTGDGKLSTLLHEVGHAELHRDTDGRQGKSVAQKELEADLYSMMLEIRLGIQPTEARCLHLGSHHQQYLDELASKLPEGESLGLNAEQEVMDNVLRRYYAVSPVLDQYVSRQAGIDAQLNAAGVKHTTEPSPQPAENSPATSHR